MNKYLKGIALVALLGVSFVMGGAFSTPMAHAAVPGFMNPAMERSLTSLIQEVSTLEATVGYFANSFTSNSITANQTLCIKDSSGTPICITGDQLNDLLTNTTVPSSPVPDATDTIATSTSD